MRLIVVTGTGTAIGKTVTTAMLAALASRDGLRVAVVKPLQTGVGADEPGDVDDVSRLSGVTDVHELIRYAEPLAPATAARRRNEPGPDIDALCAGILALRDRDVVLVEGAGGALVRFNERGETVIDLVAALIRRAEPADRIEILVTTSCALGTLHSTAATTETIASRGLTVDHLIVGDWPISDPGLAEVCNLDDLPSYGRAPLHGVITMGAGTLDRASFCRAADTALTRHLGGSFDPAGFTSERNVTWKGSQC